MPILDIYVDDATLARLRRVSDETGRTVEDLAECAIAEAALDDERKRPLKVTLPGRKDVPNLKPSYVFPKS
jgi:hypothetical protein